MSQDSQITSRYTYSRYCVIISSASDKCIHQWLVLEEVCYYDVTVIWKLVSSTMHCERNRLRAGTDEGSRLWWRQIPVLPQPTRASFHGLTHTLEAPWPDWSLAIDYTRWLQPSDTVQDRHLTWRHAKTLRYLCLMLANEWNGKQNWQVRNNLFLSDL